MGQMSIFYKFYENNKLHNVKKYFPNDIVKTSKELLEQIEYKEGGVVIVEDAVLLKKRKTYKKLDMVIYVNHKEDAGRKRDRIASGAGEFDDTLSRYRVKIK